MVNQAIALQSRAPQTDFMGRAVQQNAQMMNMMSQQRAAERQAAQAAQAMQMEQAKEARAVAGEERAVAKFALDQDALLYAKYRNMAPAVIESNSPEVYRAWLDALVEESPKRGAMLAQAMPVERFDAAALARMMATMDERFAAQYGKAITRELIDPDTGGVSAANISSIPGASFSQPVPDISRPRAGAAAAQTPTSAFPTTAAPATDAQIDEAARKILRGAGVGELGIGAEDFDRASARANELSAGGGARMQPISMTTGPQMGAQPDLTAVVQDMMSSGQISQANLQLMREMAGPDKDAQLAQILKANNIQIVPDAQPQMRSAVLRPGEDAAPQMQQVQFNPNAFEQARAKPTGQSPVPGSSQVPIPRVRAEAEAARPSELETYATRRAGDQAAADVKFLETVDGALDAGRNNLRLIDRAIGGARVDEKTGKVIYPSGGRKPHPGFEQVVGMGVPFLRLWPGSNEADFDTLLKQITGATFLKAFETLKGGGQITEKEGEKATEAISRLRRNISEKEFIIAANELRELMATAVKRAETRAARLRGQPSAPSGERRTPTKPKVLKYNPATGDFE